MKSAGFFCTLGLGSIATLGMLAGAAHAYTAKQLVGTWQLAASVNTTPGGKEIQTFGQNPLGMAMFTADGRFMQLLLRNDLPKIASNNRGHATADEAKTIFQNSIGLFGRYSVRGKILTLTFDGSTFPNWDGTTQTRDLSDFNHGEMKWNVPASSIGGRNEITWKRIK